MSTSANSAKLQLEHLSLDIRELNKELADLTKQRLSVFWDISVWLCQFIYLSFLRWFRSPLARFTLWPVAVMIVGPLISGAGLLVLLHLQSGSYSVAAVGFLVGAALGAAVFPTFLYVPSDATVERGILEIHSQLRVARTQLKEINCRLSSVKETQRERVNERDQLLHSVQYAREQLLSQNWKAMRGTDWEAYLEEVCHALGATVETTRVTGDQGVDLVVQFGARRIAVQTKGYSGSVGNSSVQEAAAGKAHYRCNACAVITNSRFTRAAIELAASNDCNSN